MKGLANVGTGIGLHCLAYNMRRAMTIPRNSEMINMMRLTRA